MITINKRFLSEVSRILDVFGPTVLVLIEAAHMFHSQGMHGREQLAAEQMNKIQHELMTQVHFLIYKYNIKASIPDIVQAVGPHRMNLKFGIAEPGFSNTSTPIGKEGDPL